MSRSRRRCSAAIAPTASPMDAGARTGRSLARPAGGGRAFRHGSRRRGPLRVYTSASPQRSGASTREGAVVRRRRGQDWQRTRGPLQARYLSIEVLPGEGRRDPGRWYGQASALAAAAERIRRFRAHGLLVRAHVRTASSPTSCDALGSFGLSGVDSGRSDYRFRTNPITCLDEGDHLFRSFRSPALSGRER